MACGLCGRESCSGDLCEGLVGHAPGAGLTPGLGTTVPSCHSSHCFVSPAEPLSAPIMRVDVRVGRCPGVGVTQNTQDGGWSVPFQFHFIILKTRKQNQSPYFTKK